MEKPVEKPYIQQFIDIVKNEFYRYDDSATVDIQEYDYATYMQEYELEGLFDAGEKGTMFVVDVCFDTSTVDEREGFKIVFNIQMRLADIVSENPFFEINFNHKPRSNCNLSVCADGKV